MSELLDRHREMLRKDQLDVAIDAPEPEPEQPADFLALEYLVVICEGSVMFQVHADPYHIAAAVKRYHQGGSFGIETLDGRVLHFSFDKIISLSQQNAAHVAQENAAREQAEAARFGR